MEVKAKAILATAVCITAMNLRSQPTVGMPLWSFDAGGPIIGSPALAADGTIHITVPDALYAVTNMGSNKWIFPLTSASGQSSPVIGVDGTVYVSSGNLYAVNADGSYPANSEQGSPAIGFDNTTLVEGYSYLYAISARIVNER